MKYLGIQEVNAKKILNEKFVKFQNEAWRTIKILRNRADEKLEEFEVFEIEETLLQEQLTLLKDITFEKLRDSWIGQKNPLRLD